MGLIIILIILIAICIASEIVSRGKELPFDEVILKICRKAFLISFVLSIFLIVIIFIICSCPQDFIKDYSESNLVETIELQEMEENIYVEYSYSSEKYSYLETDTIKTIAIKDNKNEVKEIYSNNEKSRIEHYILKGTDNFLLKYLPIKRNLYKIYLTDDSMIKRLK